jgi:hypothetical protein
VCPRTPPRCPWPSVGICASRALSTIPFYSPSWSQRQLKTQHLNCAPPARPPALCAAGSFLHQALRALLPKEGRGRFCSWGPGRDLPAVFSTCARGPPGPDHAALFDATRAAFPANCSGLAAHQDVAYFDAVGLDYSRTLTVTALRHPVDRVLSAYFYSLRQGAPFVKGYEPKNESDFSGLLRFVADDPADASNLMARLLGGGRHCAWPGTAPPTPPHRLLHAAKRNLARVCVLVISVRLLWWVGGWVWKGSTRCCACRWGAA